MANGSDNEFTILLKTIADTAGIKETSAEYELLKANLQSGVSPSIASQLAKAGTIFDPSTGAFVSASLKEGAEASKELSGGLLSAGINATRARQEAIILVRELATGVPTTRTLSSLLGSLGIPIAAAGVAAIAVVSAIKAANEQEKKLNDELEKERSSLSKNAEKWGESARSAQSMADVEKVINSALSELEKTHDKVTAAQSQQLSFATRTVDALLKLQTFLGLNPLPGETFAQRLEATKKAYQEIEKAEQEAAADAIRTGQRFEQAFDAKKAEPLAQAVGEVARGMRALKDAQSELKDPLGEDLKLWEQYQKEIDASEKQLRALIQLDKDRAEFQKANVEGLSDEEAKHKDIEDQLERAEKILKAMGVDARDLNAAFAEGEKRAGAEGEAIRKAAIELAKARGAAGKEATGEAKGLAKDLQTPPDKFLGDQQKAAAEHEAERMALEQKRREAVATGDTERAKEIEKQQQHDTFYRDQEKERLQRYSALQESIGAGPDEYATLKNTGTEGARKYYAAQDRLAQIYAEEAEERKSPEQKQKEAYARAYPPEPLVEGPTGTTKEEEQAGIAAHSRTELGPPPPSRKPLETVPETQPETSPPPRPAPAPAPTPTPQAQSSSSLEQAAQKLSEAADKLSQGQGGKGDQSQISSDQWLSKIYQVLAT